MIGDRCDHAFVFQVAERLVEVAYTQLPAIAEYLHINGGIELAWTVNLEGEEQVVSLAKLSEGTAH